MLIKLTLNELKQLAFKSLGLESVYRPDQDLLISNHNIEVVDVKSKLEEGPG